MKKIFTLVSLFLCSFLVKSELFAQCNYSAGGNGTSTALGTPIVIDGNMSDWAPILNDPDNNSYDGTTDLDAPIADAGRDFTRFAFTEDASYLYIYLRRAGSSNNSVDILFYADINNNGTMDSREPIIHINWSGANGNAGVAICEYQPSLLGILPNSITSNLDGSSLMGIVLYRGSAGSAAGEGSADGMSVEVKIPFSTITTLNILGLKTDQLTFGQDFKFHVSTINGNISSIPNLNSINDNFGGCLTAPVSVPLPVSLVNFQGNLNDTKISLQWTTAENETADKFEIERSFDGATFSTGALVFASEKAGIENYEYHESVNSTGAVYYRLKMFDKNQKINYSKTLVFNSNQEKEKTFNILNNPATDKITFTFTAEKSAAVEIDILDINGRLHLKQIISAYKGSNISSISLPAVSQPGIYLLQLKNGGEIQTLKFVKQ